MFSQFPKKTLFSKLISGIVAVSFILTSVPVFAYESFGQLRVTAGEKRNADVLKDAFQRASLVGIEKWESSTLNPPQIYMPDVKLFGENYKVGGKTIKDQEKNVGQVMTLLQLLELIKKGGIAGSLLGHSANRQACVNELSKNIEEALTLPRVDTKTVKEKAEKEANEIIAKLELDNLIGTTQYLHKSWLEIISAEIEKALTEPRVDKDRAKIIARERASARFNEIMNHRILALLDAGIKDIPICVGGSKEEILEQLNAYFNRIPAERLKDAIFYVANEPPDKIGKVADAEGKDVAADTDEVRDVHQAIYDLLEVKYGKDIAKSMWGKSFLMLYGASADGNNIDRIMAVKSERPDMAGIPLVHGVLFATSGKTVDGYLTVAKGVDRAARRDNSQYVCIVNLKAFNNKDKTPPDQYMKAIYAAINKGEIDPSRTSLFIVEHDSNLKEWQEALAKAEAEFMRNNPAFWLSELYYPAEVKETELIGDGYTKETLTYEAKAGEFINSKLKALFKDDAKEGDVYVFLKKDGKVFALGKENKKDHTLATVSTVDLSDVMVKTEYYSMLFEFVSKITEKTGEFIELVEQDGERLKRFISKESQPKPSDSNPVAAFEEEFSLGNRIKGIKYWSGDEENFSQKFFQMEYRSNNAPSDTRSTLITFKQSPRKISGGLSLIMQPKQEVFINGAGTVGYEVAESLRKTGFFVKGISVGTLNEKARDAYLNKGYTLYFYDTKDKEKFEKEKINVVGNLEDILKIVDLVVDGSPEEGVENKKIYAKFPHLKVIYQGGEEEDITDSGNSFSSTTNYGKNVGQKDTRVVSCNTTGLSRTAAQVAKVFENMIIKVYLQRRGTDPNSSKTGPIDGTVIDTKKPSHHAPDARTVLTDEINKNIKAYESYASKNPTTHFHVHHVNLRTEGLNAEKVKEILKVQSRVGLVEFKKEFDTSNIFQLFTNYLKRPQSYMAVAYVFADNPELPGEVDILLAVDQQTIVVPENPNAAQALLVLSKDENPAIRLVDEAMGIDVIKKRIEKIAPVKLAKKPSTPKAEVKLPIDVFTESDVTVTGTVGVRDDINSSKDAEGNIVLSSKLFNAAKVYTKAAKRGNKVVAISHQGRKKDGEPDKDYTEELDQHAKIMSKLTGETIGYVPDLFGDVALNAISKMKSGKISQLKNARSWEIETDESMSPEEHSKTPLIQNLSKVLDYIEFSNLAILHRYNVTVDGWREDMPIILGDKVIKDIANIENVRQILMKSQPCLFLAGGAKIDDYLVLVDKGLESGMFAEVKTGGLFGELALLAQGYQLGKPTMKILEKQFKKFESEKGGYGTGLDAMIKEVKDLLRRYSAKIDVPIDVAFINKNGERQVVTIEEKHKTEAITDEYEIRDIGDATADKYAQDIKNAKGILIKGPLGDVAKKETAVGSQKAYSAVEEKQKIDPGFNSVLGGGDAGTAFDMLKISKDKFTVVVDAGGALIVYLAEGPNGLPGLVAAERSKKYILEKAKALNVDAKALLNYKIVDKSSYNTVGGFQYGNFVDVAKKAQEVSAEKFALIVDTDKDLNYFKSPGARNTLLKTLELGGDNFKLGIFGKNAKNFSALLGGDDNIITADTDKELIADLKKRGITRIKILEPSENPAFTTAATLTALYNTSEVYNAFEEFYKGTVDAGVIEKQVDDSTLKEVLGKINAAALSEQIGAIELPEIKLTTTAQDVIDAERQAVADFITSIAG